MHKTGEMLKMLKFKGPTHKKVGPKPVKRQKKYTPPPWRPSLFFFFRGLRLYGVYPSFRTYGVYPFPLFSQENGIHHSLFCSVTSGSGDRLRKEGVPRWWCILFFPLSRLKTAHMIQRRAGNAEGYKTPWFIVVPRKIGVLICQCL